MWSVMIMECEVWSVGFRVYDVECGDYGVWSVEY